MITKEVKILLICPDETFSYLIKSWLERVKNINYVLKCTFEYEIKQIAVLENQFDLFLIFHSNENKQNGLEIIENCNIKPVIMLTNIDEEELHNKAIQLGASDSISIKQLSPILLEKILRFSIQGHRQLQEIELFKTRFNNLKQLFSGGIIIFRPNEIYYCNDKFLKILGYDNIAELKELNVNDIFDFSSLESSKLRLKKLLKNKINQLVIEYTFITKDNKKIYVEAKSFLTECNKKKAIFALVNNICEKKRIESKVNNSESYLQDAVIKPLEEQLDYIDDLKNEDAELNFDETLEDLSNITNETLDKIKMNLEISRLEKGNEYIETKEFNLLEVFLELDHTFEEELNEHKVTLLFMYKNNFIVKGQSLLINGNRQLLEFIFSTIIELAIESSPIDSSVKVEISLVQDFYLIEIICKSKIEENILRNIEKKNIRNNEIMLSDLKLHYAALIAKKHDGSITYSTSNNGTHIYVELAADSDNVESGDGVVFN